MLQSLTLRNFKIFDAQGITIAPGKITVFIGVNGAGKSSIFQALQLLKQSAESNGGETIRYNGHEITLGSFDDIVRYQEANQTVEVSLDVQYSGLTTLEHLQPRISSDGTYTYTIRLTKSGGYTHICTVHNGNDAYVALRRNRTLEVAPGEFSLGDRQFKVEVLSIIGRPIEMRLAQPADTPDAELTVRDVHLLLSTVQVQLSSSRFTPTIRGFDRLNYDIFDSGARPSNGTDSLFRSRALANLIAERPDVAEEVGEKIQQVLGTRRGTLRHRRADKLVSPELGLGRRYVSLVNEAFGLNQLVAAMADLVLADRGGLVAIEEPEAHLHPRAQAALADTFVEFAIDEGKQVMLTTHSEHILMSLLGSVANGRMKPEDLAVYELTPEGDTVRSRRLTVNEYGQIEGGLRGFMEVDIEKVGELIASRFR